MRKFLIIIGILLAVRMAAGNTVSIPITMSGVESFAGVGPTSTPDPTDPNQFRATLTENMLVVHTPEGAVSFVVIQESESEKKNEDYFYSISFGSVSCPITRAGLYAIRIGCWDMNYIGYLRVTKLSLYDISGRYWGATLDKTDQLPAGYYIVVLETTSGTTSTKFYIQQ